MKLSVIVPVFNEENTLKRILDRVLAVPVVTEVIVVDDGSTDQTASVAENYINLLGDLARAESSVTALSSASSLSSPGGEPSYPVSAVDASSFGLPAPARVKFVRHERNRGKGAAIRTGLIHVSSEVTVIQDGDLEYDPGDFVKMLHIVESGASVVYGSRILGNNRFSYRRYLWGGMFLSALARWLYGLSITDEPTCYKMARTDIMRRLDLKCEKFEFCPEMTAKVARLGETIVEIPISYAPRSISEGKKIRWFDGVEAVVTLLKYRFWKPTRF